MPLPFLAFYPQFAVDKMRFAAQDRDILKTAL